MKNISQIKEAPSTESGNTRLNSQKMPPLEESLGIDWLDFRGLLCPTKIITFFDWVADQCDDLIDWETERACGRYVRFSCGFKSVRGGQYAYELTEGAAHVWISLPGKALAGCGSTMAQLFVAKACVEQGLSCTRLDVFLDDFGDRLAKIRSSIERAYDKGQHSGFKKLSKVISRVDWQSLPLETLYLGSRESASFVRIYDKSDRTRWERQTSREISDVVLADLLRVHEDARRTSIHLYDRSMADAIKAHLTNGIDFVRRKDKNLSRSGRCEFWQGFLNWLVQLQVKVVRAAVPHLLEKTLAWLNSQVSKTLAKTKDIFGSRWWTFVHDLVNFGSARYTQHDRDFIDLHKSLSLAY